MKYTLAIIALLGLVSAEEITKDLSKQTKKHSLAKVQAKEAESDSDESSESSDSDVSSDDNDSLVAIGSEDESNAEEESEGSSDSSDNSSDSDDSSDEAKVQLEGDDDDVDHSGEFFKSTEHDKLGDGGYKRVTTPRFAADSDDIFMRSMIEQYALEGKNKDGSPNGQFWMNEANTRSAASEVLGTHKALKGTELEAYVKTYFARSWAHFDVNRSGKIEVSKMPQFMRFIASDQQMYLW